MPHMGQDAWMREISVRRRSAETDTDSTPLILRFSTLPDLGRVMILESDTNQTDAEVNQRQMRFLQDLVGILQFHGFDCRLVASNHGIPPHVVVPLQKSDPANSVAC